MESRNEKNYKGIDVSNWQGNIDFGNVKDSGVQIVYMKATEGTSFVDKKFDQNYSAAKAQGLKVGFYHYFKPLLNAKAQAKHFATIIQGKTSDCRLALDIESSDNLSRIALTDRALEFINELKSITGMDVVVYTYTYFARGNIDSRLGVYPLWIAHYGVSTPGDNPIWKNWVGFQYSSTGKVPGVSGNCDLNEFTDGILLNGVNVPEKPETPEEAPSNDGNYVVKAGDTLSGIAAKYGTTYQQLAAINGISDPSKIYVGQIIKLKGSVPSGNSSTLAVGSKIKITGSKYATGQTIPAWVKNNIYTIQQISGNKVLVKEIVSWVYKTDVVSASSTNPSPPSSSAVYHTVVYGETLSGIAVKYGTTYQKIAALNGISDPNKVYAGQKIRVK